MKAAPIPADEAARLVALHDYGILDSPPEPSFDDLTRLAAQICGTPIAVVTMIDAQRQWFKSRIGLELCETDRQISFCAHAILQPDLFEIEDATRDERFAGNPLVRGEPFIRFYAGMPLITPEGFAVGTLAVIDRVSRRLTAAQAEALRILGHQAITQLELRHKVAELNRTIAEQKTSAEALQRTEAKYRSIFENVVEGIFQTTPEGRYLSVNPMLARIYGYDTPEQLMTAVADIEHQIYVDPKRRSEFSRLIQSTGTVTKFESQVYRKDRSVIWISENARAVRDSAGVLLYYEGTVEDVTEQKLTEEKLRNSEVLYHSLVETLPQNIFRKDLQGRFTFANQRFCTTINRSLQEIIDHTDFDLFPVALAQKYQRDDRRVIETLQTFETVEAHQTPEGDTRYVQVMKTPLFAHSGQVVGVQGIFWDVTERKKMEEDLAYERDLLQTLLDNVPDSIYFKDVQSKFIKCSKALAQRFGVSDARETIGKSDSDFFTREHWEPALRDEQEIIRTGKPLIGITEKEVWRDGQTTWALTTKIPFRDRQGKIIGTLGVSKDITALKRAEEELAKARDAAVESTRLKSEFLANVSHEIRTPMNAIIGMSGLLIDTELDVEQRDYAETVRHSADNLLTIVNDLLDFSKIEAGKLTMETIDFDLREVVEGSVELLAERAHAKGIELADWFHEEAPRYVRGDPGRLRQILTNLIGNAVKFTEKGEVIVEVEREHEQANGITVRFTVRDTGIGIPPKAIPTLFHAFTQADGSTTRKYGGTGLGLAIAKQLVELMHGSIHVESTEGQGAKFWFTATLPQQPEPTRAASKQAPRTILPGLLALIVDDNATNRQIVRHQLAAWKMRSEEAANAAEAMALLRAGAAAGKNFDLVILDMQMPETDGLTLAQQIQADDTIPRSRIIMLTSMGDRLEQEVLLQAGIAACVVKPIKQSRLFDVIANVMAAPAAGLLSVEVPAPGTGKFPAEVQPKSLRVLLAEDNRVNQKLALKQLEKLGFAAQAVGNGLEVLAALQKVPYDIVLMDCQMPE
ncbi:MAG: PAS domain S-box protein, partial [Verrucomicrobia bacterium]|nr:PAS domain S-box protein [Verrucomicrobiota bacterium]